MSTSSTPASASPDALRDQRHRAVFFEAFDRQRQHLLHQAIDDLDPGQVALVHGAVERLPGEGLVMQRTVRFTIEKAAELVLEFLHPGDRGLSTAARPCSWSGSHLPPSIVSMK